MLAPLSWIREFTPLDADPVAIAEALDNLGLEVEGVEAPGARDHRREGGAGARGHEAPERRQAQPRRGRHRLRHDDRRLRRAERRRRDGRAVRAVGRDACRAGSRSSGARSAASSPTGCSARRRSSGLGDDHGGILVARRRRPSSAPTCATSSSSTTSSSTSRSRRTARTRCRSSGSRRDLAAHFGLPLTVPAAGHRREPARRPRPRSRCGSTRRTAARASPCGASA